MKDNLSGLRSDNDIGMCKTVIVDGERKEKDSKRECELRAHMYTDGNDVVMTTKKNNTYDAAERRCRAVERPWRRTEGMQSLVQEK